MVWPHPHDFVLLSSRMIPKRGMLTLGEKMLCELMLLSLVFTWRQWRSGASALRATGCRILSMKGQMSQLHYLSKCKDMTGGQGAHGAALGPRGEGLNWPQGWACRRTWTEWGDPVGCSSINAINAHMGDCCSLARGGL